MTDTTWKTVVVGLIPSLNTCLIAIVTAAVSIGGTVATQRLTAPPAPAPRVVEVVKTVPDVGSTVQRLAAIEGKLDQVLAAKSKKTTTAKAK